MGGLYGVAAKANCVGDLFSWDRLPRHLGTRRGGLAVLDDDGFTRVIHDITTRSSAANSTPTAVENARADGCIGVISDFEDQPLIIGSHLGTYARDRRSRGKPSGAGGRGSPRAPHALLGGHRQRDQSDRVGSHTDQPRNEFRIGYRPCPGTDRRFVLAAADDRRSAIYAPETEEAHSAGDRVQGGRLRRNVRKLRAGEPRLPDRPLSRSGARLSASRRPTAWKRSSQRARRCRSARSWVLLRVPCIGATKESTPKWSATARALLLGSCDDCEVDLVAGIPGLGGTGHAIGYANASGSRTAGRS